MIDTRRLVEICDWIINRRAVNPEHEHQLNFVALIRGLREGTYIASVISDSGLKELWAKLDEYEEGQATILECTAELKVLSGLSVDDWSELCRHIGSSCTYNTIVKGRYQDATEPDKLYAAIPTDTRTQVFPTMQAEALVEANHWFVFIVLMSYGTSRLGVNLNGKVKSSSK